MIRTKRDDIAFGKKNEDDILPRLSVFGEVVKIEDTFSPFDFKTKDGNILIELKTRTNPKNKYPTTMVSQSKINVAKGMPHKKFVFCFRFTDGLYHIPYDAELFDTFEISEGGRCDRGIPEYNTYCYIPVDKLIAM